MDARPKIRRRWRLLLLGLVAGLFALPAVAQDPDVVFTQTDSSVIIATDTVLGGVFMIFDGIIEPTLVATQMDMIANVVGDSTRVLISSLTEWFAAGTVITYTGSAPLVVVQASDTLGRALTSSINIVTDISSLDDPNLPHSFSLSQNYPNPFNPTTEIAFALSEAGTVQLAIYDLLGREVTLLVSERLSAGEYQVSWDGNDRRGASVASGVYLYRLQTDFGAKSRKLLLIR